MLPWPTWDDSGKFFVDEGEGLADKVVDQPFQITYHRLHIVRKLLTPRLVNVNENSSKQAVVDG